MKNVSMREIGRALGVSAVTVSKALAGRSGVSETVRGQIVRKAEELGYRYDGTARSAKERQDVCVLVPDHFLGPGHSFYASLCKKLVQQLAERDCVGMLEILTAEEEARCVYPALLANGRADGLVILGQVSREYIAMLEREGVRIPYICLDFYDERAAADSVVSDGLYGAYRLTSHLIHMGHTRIGFFGTLRATSSIMDRYLGYYRSMLQHELPIEPDWIIPDRDERGDFLPFTMPEPPLTAIVCNCDRVAVELIRQLNGEGVRVPEDLSVVGFDNFEEFPCEPGLTTFSVDQDGMAREAAELIAAKLRGAPSRCGRIVTSGAMVYRESVRRLGEPEETQQRKGENDDGQAADRRAT